MKLIVPQKPSADGLAVENRRRTRLPGHQRVKKSAPPGVETVWMGLDPQVIQVSGKHTEARRVHSSQSDAALCQARNWSVGSMPTHIRPVLSDIDRRFVTMEMIVRLATDPRVEERTLHELVLRSLWLFGPEYELAKYCSNATLRTVARKLFGYVGAEFDNERNRPDFVVAPGHPMRSLTSVNVVPANEGTCNGSGGLCSRGKAEKASANYSLLRDQRPVRDHVRRRLRRASNNMLRSADSISREADVASAELACI